MSRGLSAVCCGSGRSFVMGSGCRFSVVFGVVEEAVVFGFGVLVSVA